MASLNKVHLIGRLSRDPETRYLSSGDAVTNITLAVSETWKNKDGEKQEKTEWIKVVFYKKLAEIVGEYCNKGSLIYVEGKISTRKWADKSGNDQYSTEVIADSMQMLGGKPEGKQEQKQSKPINNKQSYGGFDDSDSPPF